MRRFLTWLFRRGQRDPASAPQALPAAHGPAAPDWLPQHQYAWARFLESEPGQVLWARLQAVQRQVSIAACADPFHTSHGAGTAHGWHECGAWLLSLSRSSRVIEETDSPPPGEAVLAEIMSP